MREKAVKGLGRGGGSQQRVVVIVRTCETKSARERGGGERERERDGFVSGDEMERAMRELMKLERGRELREKSWAMREKTAEGWSQSAERAEGEELGNERKGCGRFMEGRRVVVASGGRRSDVREREGDGLASRDEVERAVNELMELERWRELREKSRAMREKAADDSRRGEGRSSEW